MGIDESITKLAYFNDQLIIGTSGAGVLVYSNKSLNPILKDVFINDIQSADHRLYVITDNELIVYDSNLNTIASKTFKQILDQVVVLESSIVILTTTSEVIFLDKALEISGHYSSNNFNIENIFEINNTLFARDNTGVFKWRKEDFHLQKEIQQSIFVTCHNLSMVNSIKY